MEAGPDGCGCWALALGSRVSSSVFVSSLGHVQGWELGHTQPPCMCSGEGMRVGGWESGYTQPLCMCSGGGDALCGAGVGQRGGQLLACRPDAGLSGPQDAVL